MFPAPRPGHRTGRQFPSWRRLRALMLAIGAAVMLAVGPSGARGIRASGPTLTANPNPVAIVLPPGKTTLTWDTGNPLILAQLSGPGGFTHAGLSQGSLQVDVGLGDNTFFLKDAFGTTLASVDVKGNSALQPVGACTGLGCIPVLQAVPPAPLTLPAKSSAHSFWYKYEEEDAWYCGLYTNGIPKRNAPDAQSGQILVGFEDIDDEGPPPFSCGTISNDVYTAALFFDWKQVNDYVKAHGFKSATLRYSVAQGDGGQCVGQIQSNSDDVSTYNPWPPIMPGGPVISGTPAVQGGVAKVDVHSVLDSVAPGAVNPNLHFVFLNVQGQGGGNDNNHCWVMLSNFSLTVTPDH